MDSPMSQDSPIEKEQRPIGRKAAKAKRGSNSTNASKVLEEISRQNAMRLEIDMKTQENERAIQLEYAKEMEYIRQEKIEKRIGKLWPWIQAICPLKQNNFGS
ncbi:unnamed protein product [Prunus armeniaca]